jgi:type IV pilus assembly protein PilP
MRKQTHFGLRFLALLGLGLALAACGSDQRELQAYIDQVKARPGQPIPPLPEVRPAPSFTYVVNDRRSPFVADTPQLRVSDNPNASGGPDLNRPREFLEQVPLDSLTMVGRLRNNRGDYGLIQDSDGLVHRVTIGNFLGQNFGRITSISDSEIQLVELVNDGLGGWLQRPAAISLND